MKNFIVTFGILLSLSFASAADEVICNFSDDDWSFLNKTLNTCNVEEQFINSPGFLIASDQNLFVKGFDISRNKQIQYIPKNLSEKFPSLLGVQINACSIKEVSESNFEGLFKLQEIDLKSNSIRTIASSAFKDNSKLEFLTLTENKLTYISADLFEPLPNLKLLLLNNNRIRFFYPNTFKNLINVRNFNAGGNDIKYLYPGTFDSLVSLKDFSLAYNQLQVIDENLFKNSKQIESIWLEFNAIKAINYTMFDDLKDLDYVDLKGNRCINDLFYKNTFSDMEAQLNLKCSYGSLKDGEEEEIAKEYEDWKSLAETCKAF